MTDIMDIEFEPQVKENPYMKTGIEWFDKILNNGIPRNGILTLSGITGTGRSTLAMQILVKGINEYGENGLYIALEESKESAINQFKGYNWEIRNLINERKLSMLDYPLSEIPQIISPTGAVKDLVEELDIKRVVVDSVFPIGINFKTAYEREIGILRFINTVRRWKTTVILTSYEEPAGNTEIPRTTYGIERFTDGWIRLGFKYCEDERIRFLEIMKLRGSQCPNKRYCVRITNDGLAPVEEEKAKNENIKKENERKKTKRKTFRGVHQKYKV